MKGLAKIAWIALVALLPLAGCAKEQAAEDKSTLRCPDCPAPRFPSGLKAPKTVDDVMPFAREAVRQVGGRTPLGLAEEGQKVVLFAGVRGLVEPNPLVLEALVKAYQEVGVNATVVFPAPEGNAVVLGSGYTSEQAYMEVANWVEGNFDNVKPAKAYLQQQIPDLYKKMYPDQPRQGARYELNADTLKRLQADPHFVFWPTNADEETTQWVSRFMDKNDKNVNIFYTGYGGREGTKRNLGKYGPKFYGNFVFDDYRDVMSKIATYPGDVWRLVEEHIIEPMAWADRVRITDPEGTDLSYDLTEQQAKDWAESTYYPGHLFVFPIQGATRLPAVFYPTLTRWIAPTMPQNVNGVVAGTRSHTGVYPRIEVIIKSGQIVEVKAGGEYGEAWRALLNWQFLKDGLQYPYYDDIGKGIFFPYEVGLGTNPKAFARYDQAQQYGRWSAERERAGVIHWGFGVEVRNDKPGEEGRFDKFIAQTNGPRNHGFHIHNMFSTIQLRIRGTDRWMTMVKNGRITALDNPEVRLLTSRYGDPDDLLAEDWIPNMPGVNAPGDYEKDYASNPWAHITKVAQQIDDGSYRYFYPPTQTTQK